MRTRGTLVRAPLAALILVLLSLGSLLPITVQAACTAFDQNSDEHCTAIKTTPWRWINYTYTDFGAFPSLDPMIEAIRARYLSVTSPQRCSITLDHIDYDVLGVGYGFPGATESDSSHFHRIWFTIVWTNVAPCDITQQMYVEVLGQRTLYCPPNSTMIYQQGPPRIGPYCSIAWWKPDERKSAGCSNCKTGQIQKGNPVQIGSGNKYQHETDYLGGGHHSLRVERHYNSILVKNYVPATFEPEPFGPGWSAEYFQRVEHFIMGGQASAYAYRPDGQILTFNLSGSDLSANRMSLKGSFRREMARAMLLVGRYERVKTMLRRTTRMEGYSASSIGTAPRMCSSMTPLAC